MSIGPKDAPTTHTADPHAEKVISGGPEPEVRALPVIQAVQRASVILSIFTPQRPRITLNDITIALNTSKATAHRYTKALRSANLLRFDAGESVYSLGPQVLTLAAAARAGLPVVQSAESHMDRLRLEVGETVVLSVWDGACPIVVATSDNTEAVARVTVGVGARLSPTESAQGRVFCAFLPDEDVASFHTGLLENPEFANELRRIRQTNVSVTSPVIKGFRTLSAPVFSGGKIVAALAVVAASISVGRDVDWHVAALKRTAQELSDELARS